jgi:hypothetical protein
VFFHLQIRSTWDPAQDSCDNPNVKSNIVTIISMFITDILLLVIMLIGLLRMGRRGTGAFSLGRLGRLLWKQVRRCTTVVSLFSLMCFPSDRASFGSRSQS